MADEVQPTVVEKKETTEVIGLDGKSQDVRNSPLAGIFDKLEAGKSEGKGNREILSEAQRERDEKGRFHKKDEPKSEEKKTEPDKPAEKPVEKPVDKVKEEIPEDPRDALRKSLEAKQEKKDEKPSEKAEEKQVEEEVPAEELKVLETDKPKTAKRIKKLLSIIEQEREVVTKTKKEAEEKATRLSELEKKLAEVKTADPATDEKIKKQLDELVMFRRRYELDKDPEIKTKFDDRVASAEASIMDTLKSRGAGKGLLDLITEEGGWQKFASSSRIVNLPNADGEVEQITAAELAEAVLQKLPLAQRKGVEAAMMEQIQTKRDKDRFIKEQEAAAADYFKKKDEEAQKGTLAEKQKLDAAVRQIEDFHKGVLEKEAFIKDKEIPASATPAEKAAIEEHNRQNVQLRAILQKNLSTADLNGLLQMSLESVRFFDEQRNARALQRENERLKAELDAKQAELTRFKTAGRSVPRSGSISTSGEVDTNAPKKPQTLAEAFDRLERGESIKEE